jgi:hypothetical protein
MDTSPSFYTILFNAVTDAIAALDRQDFGQARTLLIQGQQQGRQRTRRRPNHKWEQGRGFCPAPEALSTAISPPAKSHSIIFRGMRLGKIH